MKHYTAYRRDTHSLAARENFMVSAISHTPDKMSRMIEALSSRPRHEPQRKPVTLRKFSWQD